MKKERRCRPALLAALAVSCLLAGCGGSAPGATHPRAAMGLALGFRALSASVGLGRAFQLHRLRRPSSGRTRRELAYGVGVRVLTFVDESRAIQLAGHRLGPRRLVTVIRYPEHARARFPLVVFGHGFAATPASYSRLLRAWAQAGYVVAAPVFPLENAHAPGGPDERDIINQPRDMSFVITRMLAASAARRGPLAGLIDPHRIAVSGHSDGGETALAVAYDRHYFDRRVRAAIILSGARLPGVGFDFPVAGPPLLAVQGTADATNRPQFTYAFFRAAPRPKYLLSLLGAGHLAPYTQDQRQLAIVERVTIAFLDRYLKHMPNAQRRLIAAGDVAGKSVIAADP